MAWLSASELFPAGKAEETIKVQLRNLLEIFSGLIVTRKEQLFLGKGFLLNKKLKSNTGFVNSDYSSDLENVFYKFVVWE